MSNQSLLDEMRAVLRRLHYSIQTERGYCDWAKRHVRYHGFQTREALASPSVAEIELFLTSLARKGLSLSDLELSTLRVCARLTRIFHESV